MLREEIALLMRRWEQVKAGDGAVVLIGGDMDWTTLRDLPHYQSTGSARSRRDD
jgi:hypothetical protein